MTGSVQPNSAPPPHTESVIRCENVRLSFRLPERQQRFKDVFMSPIRALRTRTFEALNGVSFSLGSGEILGIVGNNGAGKSTLLRVLGGVYYPDAGQVSVKGRIGMLMELGAGFHPDLTGRENVYLNASLLGVSTEMIRRCFDNIVEWSGLEEFIDMEVRHYSSGMKARLGFAVAAELRPDVMLIDEVLSVGDADFRRRCDQRFDEFVAAGTTIVLVTHTLNLVRERCTKALWLDRGQARIMGEPDEVLAAYRAELETTHKSRLSIENAERGDPKKTFKEKALARPADTAGGQTPGKTSRAETKMEEESRKEPAIPLVHPSDANPPVMPRLPTQPRRWGLGGLRIEDVVMRTRAGERRYSFNVGEYMRFDLYYTLHRPIENPMFGVQIATRDGTLVTGVNSLINNAPIVKPDKQGLVTIEVPELLLSNGEYLVSVFVFAIEEGERVDIDYRQHCALFEVMGGPRWKQGVCWLPRVNFQHFPGQMATEHGNDESLA